MPENRPTLIRVITWLPLGGIERRLVTVAPMLRDRGWNVRVLCIREEGPLAEELRRQSVPVDVIRFRSRLSPPGIRQMAAYFRQHQASVVHAHMYRSYIPATVAGRLARVPAVFGQVHNVDSWDSPRQAFMDRLISGWRTGTIVVSRKVQEDVHSRLKVPTERLPILYNGIDLEKFQPDDELMNAIRQDMLLDDNAVVFLVPARLHPQKNPSGVLDAAAELRRQNPDSKFLLLFAGDGKLREGLEEETRKKDLVDYVRFLGARDDMPALYNAADAVVLSSFKEGFSNAVVEALGCGKPVIASDVGGNAEAIGGEGPRCGWIHDSGDRAALVSQMAEALRLGRSGLKAMEPACTARARRFSVEELVQATNDLYCQALGLRGQD